MRYVPVYDNDKALYRQALHQIDHNKGRYQQMLQLQHQDYMFAPDLPALENIRLVSRFRYGCYGLHVDTGDL